MIKIERPDCPYPKALESRNYKHEKNKTALKNASFDKCMYCESIITDIDFGQVEHFRPKDENKYPHLEFEWGNLGFVCPKCNNSKNNKFDESTPYIDPYKDEPEKHFTFCGPAIKPLKGCERAELSIIDIDLNRTELIERRSSRLDSVDDSISKCYRTKNTTLREKALTELLKEKESNSEYSLMIKVYFNSQQVP